MSLSNRCAIGYSNEDSRYPGNMLSRVAK